MVSSSASEALSVAAFQGSMSKPTLGSGQSTYLQRPCTEGLVLQRGYRDMHEAFYQMIAEGKEPHSNWQSGRENMLTCVVAQIAVAENRMVQRTEFSEFDWRIRYPQFVRLPCGPVVGVTRPRSGTKPHERFSPPHAVQTQGERV